MLRGQPPHTLGSAAARQRDLITNLRGPVRSNLLPETSIAFMSLGRGAVQQGNGAGALRARLISYSLGGGSEDRNAGSCP